MKMTVRAEALTLMLALAALTACAFPGVAADSSSRKLLNTQCLGWASSYGQCGGIECPNGSNQCSDAAYLCCPSDFSCQRLNQNFWSCYPEGSDIGSPAKAPVPAPSGAPALAPAYGLSPPSRSPQAYGLSPPSQSPPAYGLSPTSQSPPAYGSSSSTPTAPAPAPPSAPRQTRALAEYAPPAEEDAPPSQWWSGDCDVVDNNAGYPNGLICSGDLPDPSCCSGDTCYTYSFWDSSKPHLAFASTQPNAGLGSCTGDYLIACCPAPVPE